MPVEFRVNVLQRFCLKSSDTLLAFYEQKNEEKRATKRENKDKKNIITVAKILVLENPGIDPGTSRMQSGRSTI